MARRWLVWGLWAGVMLVVITRFAGARQLGETLARASWPWVAVAIAVHLLYFLVYALLYKTGFDLVGVRSSIGELLPLYLVSNVANALAPSGGAAAAALFIDDARSRGQSGARAAVGVVLVLFADLVMLMPFLIYGLAFLHTKHELRTYEWLGALSFVAFLLLLIGAMEVARRSRRTLERIFGLIQRALNAAGQRFRRRDLLAPEWPVRTAEQFAAAADAIASSPRRLAVALGISSLLHAMNFGALVLLFIAFGQPVGLGALSAGFGLGIVFYVVSIIPQGMAVVEGVMALVFTSLGYPGEKVAAIVLAFRGLNYWMPLVAGMIFFRRLAPATARIVLPMNGDRAEAGRRAGRAG
jgi:uncharacterized protein (TIRG00374 family)